MRKTLYLDYKLLFFFNNIISYLIYVPDAL